MSTEHNQYLMDKALRCAPDCTTHKHQFRPGDLVLFPDEPQGRVFQNKSRYAGRTAKVLNIGSQTTSALIIDIELENDWFDCCWEDNVIPGVTDEDVRKAINSILGREEP